MRESPRGVGRDERERLGCGGDRRGETDKGREKMRGREWGDGVEIARGED